MLMLRFCEPYFGKRARNTDEHTGDHNTYSGECYLREMCCGSI